jgi:hypothetical protein
MESIGERALVKRGWTEFAFGCKERGIFEGGNDMDQVDRSRHGLIREEESVLVVIEMQEKLFPAVAEKEKLLGNVLRLVRFARILDLPVVVTEMEKLGNTLPEVMSELKGVQPVVRSEFNCFGSQVFSSRIKELERGVLILAGIEAHICIAQTALHAARIQSPRGQRRHILSLVGEPQRGAGANGTGRGHDEQHGDGHLRAAEELRAGSIQALAETGQMMRAGV